MSFSQATAAARAGLILAIAAILPACGALDAERAASDAEPPTHVDSVFTIDEEIRRFRAGIPESVSALSGGAASRDELVSGFLSALERNDRDAFSPLVLSIAEFAYLYYPHTRFTTRPYELSPALVWFQTENHSSRGLSRALTRYGGRPLPRAAYDCPNEPELQADNRIWSGCTVSYVGDDGNKTSVALLGPIIERAGRFKFLSYANDL